MANDDVVVATGYLATRHVLPDAAQAALPMDIWRLVVDLLAVELNHGPPVSIGIAPTLKALGACSRDLQAVCHPIVYRALTITTQHLAMSAQFGLKDLPRYLLHAKRVYSANDRDPFSRPRIYRMSTRYQQESELVDRRFCQLLWRLADQLEEAILMWLPTKSPDAAHALRQCGRLRFLSISGDLPRSLRASENEAYPWPQLAHARFFRCSLASVAHILFSPRKDCRLERLYLDRVTTGGEDDIFPACVWHKLQTLSIVDMGILDVRDIFESLRLSSLESTPPLAHLSLDCSTTDIASLHSMLDALSRTELRSLAIMSSPDEENPSMRGGHLLFQHIASALPKLEQLLFMRGNGYEVVPFIASLQGYAFALSTLRLRALTLNHSNGYHSPAEPAAACVFAGHIDSLESVSFRGKVSMAVGVKYQIVRNGANVEALEMY